MVGDGVGVDDSITTGGVKVDGGVTVNGGVEVDDGLERDEAASIREVFC